MLQVHVVSLHKPHKLQVHVISQHKTRHMLQVHVISQHKPDISCKYTSSLKINQTEATYPRHQ